MRSQDITKENINLLPVELELVLGHMIFSVFFDDAFFDEHVSNNSIIHNHCTFEVHFIFGGEGFLEIGENRYSIKEGSCFFLNKRIPHRVYSVDSLLRYCIRFNFEPLKKQKEKNVSFFTDNIRIDMFDLQWFMWEGFGENVENIREIHKEILAKKLGYLTIVQSLLAKIIINILRAMEPERKETYEISDGNIDKKTDYIIDCFFQKNYFLKTYIGDLADELKVSKRQLERMIKKRYRISFKQKIIERRVEKAKDLLRNTELKVDEIGRMVGYEYSGNFINIFKKSTNMTPGEYRKDTNPTFLAGVMTMNYLVCTVNVFFTP